MKRVFVLLLTLLVLFVPSGAHSGRTDSQGGHTDRSTGEYHFHHGYPAHQHENGVCPYDFDETTDIDEYTKRFLEGFRGTIPSRQSKPGTSSGVTDPKQVLEAWKKKYSQSSGNASSFAEWTQKQQGTVSDRESQYGTYMRDESGNFVKVADEESDESPRSFWSNVGYSLGLLLKGLLVFGFLIVPTIFSLFGLLYGPYDFLKSAITTFRKAHARGLSCREYRRLVKLREAARREARQMLRESGERSRAARALRFEILKRTLPLETFGFVPAQLVAQACGMPYDTTIGGDGLPKLIKAEDWGERYTFYVSSSGRAYHRTLQCSGASIKRHALQLTGYAPCKRCQPTLPSLGWFDRYSHAAGQLIALHVPVVIVDEQSLC